MNHTATSASTAGATPLGLLDREAMCELLRISRPTFEKIVKTDDSFPRSVRLGKSRYWRFQDVESWIAGKTRVA